MLTPVKIGISSCLLGNRVRYDGGHSHDPFLTRTLGLFTQYVPVCPEVECGMPIPREAMRLVGDPEAPRLVTRRTGEDKTRRMQDWIPDRLDALQQEDLCGFIFKSRSPSSGLYRVKVYGEDGKMRTNGVGLFARAFTQRFPGIPVEEDGRLHDPALRERFIEAIFTLKRWRDLLKTNQTPGGLVDFHTRNKYLILAHSPELYKTMGKLTADAKGRPVKDLFNAYEILLLKALDLRTTTSKNINVLQHMMGFFKTQLTSFEKQEMIDLLQQYRDGHVPLIVPITLIRHYVHKYDQPWLKAQTYLNPHPLELRLRNYYS